MQRLVRQGILALFWLLSWSVAPWLQAQSLGTAQVLSLLGDPVEVEILVENWQALDLTRTQVVSATSQQYEAFNLSHLPIVDKLNFNLIGPNSSGEVKVLISSRDAVSEPFVELLLALRWPQGSALREYVLLFDPPPQTVTAATKLSHAEASIVQESAVAATKPPVVAAESADTGDVDINALAEEPAESVVETVATAAAPAEPVVLVKSEPVLPAQTSVPDVKTQVAIEVETVAPQLPATPPVQDERRRYQVRSGDTLWVVAKQFHPAGVGENLYQFLTSAYELNRSAFINGNISLLKANATLRIPMANEIAAINPSTAQQLFEQRWQEGINRSTAVANGETLPALSPLYEPASSEIAELAKQLESQIEKSEERPLGTEASESATGLLGAAGVAQVLVQAQTPISTQAAAPMSVVVADAVPVTQVMLQPVDSSQAKAIQVANPYVQQLNATASNVQALITRRQQRLSAVEQQIAALKKQLDAAQQAKTQSNSAGGSSQAELWLYAGVALLLLGAVTITIRLALRLNADFRKLGV
jgi:pilus assembly protein FimV